MRHLPFLFLALSLAVPLHAGMTVDQLIEDRAAQYVARKQRQQDELHAATLPLFVSTAARAKAFTLREGLPHPGAEKNLHEAEKARVPVFTLHGETFYATPITPSRLDTEALRNLLSRPSAYLPYTGLKLCGGFHADYAIEWTVDDHAFSAFVCFTCHEIKLISTDTTLRCDLPDTSLSTLAPLLKTYRSQRPATPEPNVYQ